MKIGFDEKKMNRKYRNRNKKTLKQKQYLKIYERTSRNPHFADDLTVIRAK